MALIEERVAELERKVNIIAECLKLLTAWTEVHQEVTEADGRILERLNERVSGLEDNARGWDI